MTTAELSPKDSEAVIRNGLSDLAQLAANTASSTEAILEAVALYCRVLEGGGTLFFAGNGGSAADAQHVATEYVVRYRANRRPFAAIALTTDTSLITAAGNDLSFEEIFARQVEALCSENDLLVLHSTSGNSANMILAAKAARARQVPVVALLGRGGGQLKALVDLAIVVQSASTSHIQELHLAIEHLICECVEMRILSPASNSGKGGLIGEQDIHVGVAS